MTVNCSKELQKIEYDALHRLLRARYDAGLMTVITTNKTVTELGELLGENVADRLREGLILKFVDDSQRGQEKTRPQGTKHVAQGIRYMPNPEMDPDKAYIPYVEPAGEAKDDTAVTAPIEPKTESQAADHSSETSGEQSLEYDEKAWAAAIASMGPDPTPVANSTLVSPSVPAAATPSVSFEPATPRVEPVTVNRRSMFPPPYPFGERDDQDEDEDEGEETFID